MNNCFSNFDKMENPPICIVCAKSCVTSNDCKTCSECLRSLHLTCSTSKIKDKSFQNKRFVSSCLLCDSRMVDASFDKQFVTTRFQDLTLETCNQNSSYCDFFNNCKYHDVSSLNNVVKHKKDELFIIHFNVRSLQKTLIT